MANVEVILLQRVDKLGQMGEIVRVKPGYARNFLLPQNKALRANKANRMQFEEQRAHLEATNLERREEAQKIVAKLGTLNVIIIRQAGESGSLYGSVSARDIADAADVAGLKLNRQQMVLEHPIKTLGLSRVRAVLHPEVSLPVSVNVARSPEEADKQAKGERVGNNNQAEDAEAAADLAALFEPDAQPD